MNGRPTNKLRALRSSVALGSAVIMIGTLLQGVAQPAQVADSGKGRPATPSSDKPLEGHAAKVEPRKVQKGPRTPQGKPDVDWPAAATGSVRLAPPATAGQAAKQVRPGNLPLRLKAAAVDRESGSAKPAGFEVSARTLDRKAARKAGVNGLLISLEPKTAEQASGSGRLKTAEKPSAKSSRAATPRAATSNNSQRVEVTVDYADFADAYGGGWASRLQLVELPACALTSPEKKVCRAATPLPSTNDAEKQTVTARKVVLAGAAPTVLAAVASTEGGKGDYKATPLAASSSWQTNLNTGDFAWSYPFSAPDVPGGLEPSLALSYSSGAVDGRTGSTNNQSSWVGDGFDLSPGFIERRYKSCADDGVKHADGNKPGDLCWAYDNAFVSFNGKSGELVPAGANSYRFKQDDGTKIDRLASSDRGNGDDDGEYWRLTDAKGFRYYFGYHRLPGWAEGKETTDSTWTVPVYGDDAGDKCHGTTFADSWCQQAWRWNLDYAVDPHGNAIAYYYNKETNHYGRNLKAADETPYTRGGTLDRVEYGLRSSTMYGTKALAKVNFTDSERCIPDAATDCSSISTDGFYWYDTPWDLNCAAGTDCDQGRLSPSFFTRKRLTQVTSQVLDAASATYKDVDSWKLNHRWGMADTDYQLLLDSVQHTGHSATPAVTLPKTTFAYTQLVNRLDKTGDGYAPFVKSRLSTVADEYGGQIDVNYSAAACNWTALPTPQSNTTRCFPQYIGGDATDDPEQQWFNKYVVNSVTATDRTGGAPDQVTSYSYLGDAAWHYDDDDGLTKEKFKTWSQWRGYGHVRVQTGGQGGASAMKTQSDSYFLRGMDGDRASPTGGTKSESVTLGGGEGDPITDHDSAAGFAYKTASYSKPGGAVLEKTVSRPWHHETAKKTRTWGTVTANFTGTAHTKTFISLDDGAGSQWRTTSQKNTFDTVAGRPTQVDDFGDDARADDNTCTRTEYATNTTDNLLAFPSREESVAKSCADTPARPADVMSDTRHAYDNGAYGAAPTNGNVTASAELDSYEDSTAIYRESGTTYDTYGRALTVNDLTADVRVTSEGVLTRLPRSDGRTTTTEPTPATGFATTVKVTTPPAKTGDATTAQTTTTKYDALRGLQTSVKDTNDKITNFAYDALGRSTKVWLADRLTGQTPTYEFVYTVAEGKPVSVGTREIGNNGAQHISYVLYDGFLRPRQTQQPGPNGGRLLTDTFYDERGLVYQEFAPYYMNGAPVGSPLSKLDEAMNVETQTRHSYDGLGRETAAWQVAGNGQSGTEFGRTTTYYGGDRTKVVPPVGGTTTTALTDARGRTTELRQHHDREGVTFDATKYAYTPRGEVAQITGPDGAVWTNTYDLRGLKTKSTDPDKGTATSTYDIRGQLLTTTDARGTTLAHVHDGLGRKTELRKDSLTGPLRAKWIYDTLDGAKGQLAESIRYSGGQAYSNKVTWLDRLYRVRRSEVSVPASEGTLQGNYTFDTTYNPSGTVQGRGYPTAGALPATVFSYMYEDATLRPISLSGGSGVRAYTRYSLTGNPEQYEMSYGEGKHTWVTNTYEWGTQRLASSQVDREDVSTIDRKAAYSYDDAGNVLSIKDTSSAGTDNQCFQYDGLRRLEKAWTQSTATCAAQPSGTAIAGPAPYWHEYEYNKAGQRTKETLHDPSGDTAKDTTRTYTYPAATAPQPHTLTSLATTGPSGPRTDTYAYDNTGNTTSRPRGSANQTLTWDAEGHLEKASEPDGSGGTKTTEYLYDADGNRLIGRTPTETTLYLGNTEITLPKGATQPKGTRYIDLGGGNQAVQKDDGSVSFTLADHHGTAQLSIDAATHQLTARRTLPFGGLRGTKPNAWPGTKGFVGGTDDTPSTGLTHLGAREYDPGLGQFLSVDPLLEVDKPQTLNGFSYGAQNPLVFSDPSGLGLACGGSTGLGCGSGVVTHGDGSLSKNGSPTGGGVINPVVPSAAVQQTGSSGGGGVNGPQYGPTALNKWAESKLKWLVSPRPVKAAWYIVGPDLEAWDKCYEKKGRSTACISTLGDLPTFKPLKALSFVSKWFKGKKKADRAKDAMDLSDCFKCFLAGTDVLMADGSTEDIEDVEVGDQVLATDPKTGKTEPHRVTHLIRTEADKKFNKLSLATDQGIESLTATHEHPFWSPSEEDWVPARGLKPGMTLRTDKGDTVIVTANKPFTKHARTYNLTVEGLHTYYVLAGETPVLVHNSNGLCGTAALENGDWQHIVDRHRPGGALVDDAAGIFTGKAKHVRQRIADTINRGTPKPNTPDPVTGEARPGQIYEWDFGTPVGRAGPANGGGELTGVRVIVNDGKVVTAFPY
ncbi:sugar-binding protein [Streptomyces sp. NA04227]|uniref:polymorphic toxin-type HINT domain-containing protein n=1 Tax=Streptomyces sp. NA04227 TaxID=2742136 RepID=UPI001591E204|nr:polymorphic toxin-type HINT domain-containing protein [Streptomyces sp. NA04227]QKW09053.1 sugar-binding protein [Streptomyces sp. NA04227]